jgi:hypothetical protein
MQVLTEAEATIFLAEHRMGDIGRLTPQTSRSEVTTDVGRRCGYAKMLTDYLINSEASIVCLNVTDWNVWPSSTNMDLFYSYRRCLGEQRFLKDAHFHVFTAAEANEFRNILHLGLISLFDIAGASTTTDFRFFASHDEYIDVAWHEGASWLSTMESFFSA